MPGAHFEDTDGAVPVSRGQSFSIRTEEYRTNESSTALTPGVFQSAQFLPGCGVPEFDHTVIAAGSQQPSIRTPRHRFHGKTVVHQSPCVRARRDVPKLDRPVSAGGSQLLAIGTEHGVVNAPTMTRQRSQLAPGFRVP